MRLSRAITVVFLCRDVGATNSRFGFGFDAVLAAVRMASGSRICGTMLTVRPGDKSMSGSSKKRKLKKKKRVKLTLFRCQRAEVAQDDLQGPQSEQLSCEDSWKLDKNENKYKILKKRGNALSTRFDPKPPGASSLPR